MINTGMKGPVLPIDQFLSPVYICNRSLQIENALLRSFASIVNIKKACKFLQAFFYYLEVFIRHELVCLQSLLQLYQRLPKVCLLQNPLR